MFHIGICEDEPAQQGYLEKCIRSWAERAGCKVSIDIYDSGEQFLFDYEDREAFDLLILDIQMGQLNGMELARKIRQQNRRVKIIFLTGVADYALEGYEVGAVRYLLKPLKPELLEQLLEDIRQELKQTAGETFMFTRNGETCKVPFGDIIYLEAEGHYLSMVTTGGHYQWKSSFTSVAEEFEARGFFLLKRGLYVNLEYVSRITKTDCILESGEQLPVSKNRYRQLNEAFISYYRGN
ncbi:MAG: response regulator transcription factor [Lachnospiraceae bacterium]|nr:response regulator transcription factor [Lachnospiraceae bacterium]